MYLISLLVTVRLLCRSPKPPTPSVLAVTGTRRCAAGGDSASAVRRRAALFAFRLSLAVWQLLVLVSLCARNALLGRPTHGHHYWAYQFMFYTVWNYMLQTAFWACAAACSGAWVFTASGPSAAMRRLTHMLLSVCVPASLLVSAVLWGLLLPVSLHAHKGSEELNFFSYNMHALNTLALLLEFCCLDRMLLRPGSLALLVMWLLMYGAFVVAQHAVTHFWPYFFLALDTWAAPGWYVLLAALHLVAWALAKLLSAAKARADPRLRETSTVLADVAAHHLQAEHVDLVT